MNNLYKNEIDARGNIDSNIDSRFERHNVQEVRTIDNCMEIGIPEAVDSQHSEESLDITDNKKVNNKEEVHVHIKNQNPWNNFQLEQFDNENIVDARLIQKLPWTSVLSYWTMIMKKSAILIIDKSSRHEFKTKGNH